MPPLGKRSMKPLDANSAVTDRPRMGKSWFWEWGIGILIGVATAAFVLVLLLAVITASKQGAFDGL